MVDKIKMTLAVALVIVGVWGYYHFSDLAVVLRVLMVLGGLIGAAVSFSRSVRKPGWRREKSHGRHEKKRSRRR